MGSPLLAYKQYAGGEIPLLILHGLFGSGKNWVTIARHLSKKNNVYTLDARNHGESFRAETHSLNDMVSDLHTFIAEKIKEPAILLGHSMGGLTSMAFALQYPLLVKGLIIADIAPRSYAPDYSAEFAAQSIDLSTLKSRSEIDSVMKKFVPEETLRKFLQTNVVSKPGGGYAWQINIKPVQNSASRTSFPETNATYNGPVLFLKGMKSDFIRDTDLPLIYRYFPQARIHNVENGDHWLHFTAQQEFLAVVDSFLAEMLPS